MGMYDTFEFICPHCEKLSEVQTKLGENCLDRWKVGDETTLPPGEYRLSWPCDECENYAVIVINDQKILVEVKKEASTNAQQEILYGNLRPIGTDPKKEFKEFAERLREQFKKMDEEES